MLTRPQSRLAVPLSTGDLPPRAGVRLRQQAVFVNAIVIRASMADLIAVAFYRIGYRPRESLVMVGLHGARHRVGVVRRLDLPLARHRAAVVETQVRAMRREGGERFIALVVSDVVPLSTAPGPVRLPHRRLARQVRGEATRQGCDVMDIIAVGSSWWRSYLCSDLTCCPSQGFSLEAALTGPAAAQLVAEGYVLAPDEASFVADVDPVTGRSDEEPDEVSSPPAHDAARALARWRGLLARPESAGVSDLVWFGRAFEDRWLRDAVLLTLVPGVGTIPEEVLAGGDAALLEVVFDADPDDELLERGRLLLSAVARAAPPGGRADAIAMLAWAAWWQGHGPRGRLLAERALADVPDHRLAALVAQMLSLGVVPSWVERRRESLLAHPGCW